MRYEILGPLRITNGSAPVTITASRERTLLAMLLLHANQPVPRTQLIEAIWAGHPPPGAHNQLQGCVSRLRRLLAETVGSAGLIVTEPAGYRATVAPDDLDLVQFRDYVAQARQAAAAGDQTQASNHYRAGLALWRGPTLAGVDSDPVRHAAAALDEEHDQAVEERIDLELAIDAGPLVAELTDLVSRHPHRERLHRALMLALYRSGRQADALAAYQRARRLLRDELGIEPGVELQRLHQAILNRDPALDDPPGPAHPAPAAGARSPVPRELPADVAGFTGRTDALKTLDDELLTDAPDGGPAPVVISAIAGTAGVGKTALAVHWAHRIANRFPDGQLYLNLRGYATEPPLRPIDALAALLRSMSTPPDQIPTEEAEAAGRYRSQLAGRRMLVVLDNAGSVDQVRPLLPGSPGCLALITSRDRLAGLVARDGARRINLDVLPPDEAYAMLNRLLGGRRVADEPEATAALAQACAYLPLALRIAAAGLTDHPDRSIAGYVAQLTNGDRLAMLRADGDQETAVLATLDLSYQRLPTDTQRLFRLLGLVPGPDFTPAAAAALAGSTVEDVQPLLTRLTSAHLLTEHAPGRYTFHDLLRLYGRQRAEAEDPADLRAGAMTRLLTWYLHTADSAATLLYPRMFRLPAPPREVSQPPAGFDRSSGAAVWLEAERANLV